jgi:hypothetical protein
MYVDTLVWSLFWSYDGNPITSNHIFRMAMFFCNNELFIKVIDLLTMNGIIYGITEQEMSIVYSIPEDCGYDSALYSLEDFEYRCNFIWNLMYDNDPPVSLYEISFAYGMSKMVDKRLGFQGEIGNKLRSYPILIKSIKAKNTNTFIDIIGLNYKWFTSPYNTQIAFNLYIEWNKSKIEKNKEDEKKHTELIDLYFNMLSEKAILYQCSFVFLACYKLEVMKDIYERGICYEKCIQWVRK